MGNGYTRSVEGSGEPIVSRRSALSGFAAAGAAGLAGCSGNGPGATTFSPGRDSTTEWPLPGRDPRATNYAPDAVAPRTPPAERWRAETGRAVGRTAVADGTVFVPAENGLHALRLRDGEERWRAPIRPYGVTEGALLVASDDLDGSPGVVVLE
jgi:hypothetical protein